MRPDLNIRIAQFSTYSTFSNVMYVTKYRYEVSFKMIIVVLRIRGRRGVGVGCGVTM